MADAGVRLRGLSPIIERLMSIGGTPGLSIGVITKDKPIFHENYGFRDVENQLPVTTNTIFPICSLTKAFTAAAIALLVEDDKLSWDSLVKDVLPTFQPVEPLLHDHTTITDILSHRTGMGWGENLIIGSNGDVLLRSTDVMKYINQRPLIGPFRARFGYNNLHYELAGHVIEHVSGQSYFDFIQSRILEPLGMTRTSFQTPTNNVDNVTVCYNTLDDASAVPINFPKMGDDGYGAASGGARSTVKDLVELYRHFMKGFNAQSMTGKTSSEGSHLKQLTQIMSGKIAIDPPTRHEVSYAFGWARVQLPGRLGQIGINPRLLPHGMPLVGKGTSNLLLFHQGSFPGSLTYAALLPELEAVVVVLTNSLALNDVADWVGQLVIEELLNVPSELKNDFVELAEMAVAENLKWYSSVIAELEKDRKSGTFPKPLEYYVGTYWDDHRFVKIEVTLEDGTLQWLIQGLEAEKFPLKHHQDDTFTWLLTRNELSKRGRWVGEDQDASFWKVHFEVNGSGQIHKLIWAHDRGVPPMICIKA